ncbi:MAG: hypothetical protein ABIY70_03190 [Capsulimonas sp.]|uniref:hypothetical protein n=1 Tax=Capsulimonas sp. TaxID=2494211 RepID=UPI003265D876
MRIQKKRCPSGPLPIDTSASLLSFKLKPSTISLALAAISTIWYCGGEALCAPGAASKSKVSGKPNSFRRRMWVIMELCYQLFRRPISWNQ